MWSFLLSGLAGHVGDWRLWLGVVIGGAVLGMVWLYLSALVLKWIGSMLGGEATALQLRAVVAWSTVPSIVGARDRRRSSFSWRRRRARQRGHRRRHALACGRRQPLGHDRVHADVRTRRALRLLAHDAGLCAEPRAHGVRGRDRRSHLAVPAVQHPRAVDGADPGRGRLCLRRQVSLRLQPVFAAVLAAAVLGPHPRRPNRSAATS